MNPVSRPRRLQIIGWDILRQLSHLSPLPYGLVVATDMLRVEVNKGFRVWVITAWLVPHLTKDADIDSAHELLPDDIDAVCCKSQLDSQSLPTSSSLTDVLLDDVVLVLESTFAKVFVIVEVVVEAFSEEVLPLKSASGNMLLRISARLTKQWR